MTDSRKILGPTDLPDPQPEITCVDVHEWGGSVCLCSPSSKRCDQVQVAASLQGGEAPGDDATPTQKAAYHAAVMANFHARTVALCLCDESGRPWYDDAVDGAEQLGGRPGDAPLVKRIYEQAKLLCPLNEDGVKALEKNSDPLPESDCSGSSASVATSA